MEKCKYYRTDVRQSPRYSVRTGHYTHSVEEEYSYCVGTREQDECSCDGFVSRCTHYPEKRENYTADVVKKFDIILNDSLVSSEHNLELIKALMCFSLKDDCPIEHCAKDYCKAFTDKYDIDDIEELCRDTLSHIEYLNNIIKSQQAELTITRQFVHDKGLTFDLLNYSTK